jgi:excisionase family DNA binding protein
VQAKSVLAFHSVNGVLTVAEVAAELRCSKAHVHNLINGKVLGVSPLPSLSLGRRRLVRRESLQLWIARNERGVA